MSKSKKGGVFRWTRLISVKWEDAWLERVKGTGETVVTTLHGSRSARLDVYCTQRKSQALLKQFGGKIISVDESQWKGALDKVPKPISIRGRLIIHQQPTASDSLSVSSADSRFERGEANEPKRSVGRGKEIKRTRVRRSLFFPAEMAFGSGSHATTVSCLRMLCDLESVLTLGWRMLDLGTGSGILAIAACALGAGKVLGVDFDPIAIRIARRNWQRNRAGLKEPPRFENVDVLKNFPTGRYDVICANLFAELLIQITPRILRSLSAGGWWVFSGVLAEQMPDVNLAIRRSGFGKPVICRRGKWIAGIVQKPD